MYYKLDVWHYENNQREVKVTLIMKYTLSDPQGISGKTFHDYYFIPNK